jgi:hypothetical protein
VLLLHIFTIGLQTFGFIHGKYIYVWWEPCTLHQVSRITTQLFVAVGLNSALFACSRSFLNFTNQRRLESLIKPWLTKRLIWRDGEVPPNRYPINSQP